MKLFSQPRLAVVSGSSKGIGLAIAEALYAESVNVIINGRDADAVHTAIAGLRQRVGEHQAELIPFVADLSRADAVQRLHQAHPQVDIVVNNLGVYGAAEFDEISDEQWQEIFDINVLSGVRLSRQYLAGMKQRNWGRIVFISSESAIQIPREMIHYGMTKTAQLAIARGLAETCAATGVTVNSVLPGPTLTDGVRDFVQGLGGGNLEAFTEEYFRTLRPSSLIQRFQEPAEIGSAVAFVCSEQAASINGSALRVDGGVVRACF